VRVGICAAERARCLGPVDVAGDDHDERDRDEGRDQLAPAEERPADRDVVGVRRLLGELCDRRILDMRRAIRR